MVGNCRWDLVLKAGGNCQTSSSLIIECLCQCRGAQHRGQSTCHGPGVGALLYSPARGSKSQEVNLLRVPGPESRTQAELVSEV